MSIAAGIKAKIGAFDASAYSLMAGYVINQETGKTLRFPIGAQLSEKRNDQGRVTKALYAYADGSRLEFSYHPLHGSNLKEVIVL